MLKLWNSIPCLTHGISYQIVKAAACILPDTINCSRAHWSREEEQAKWLRWHPCFTRNSTTALHIWWLCSQEFNQSWAKTHFKNYICTEHDQAFYSCNHCPNHAVQPSTLHLQCTGCWEWPKDEAKYMGGRMWVPHKGNAILISVEDPATNLSWITRNDKQWSVVLNGLIV